MKKTVLITGAYGFVGRYTAQSFAKQGWKVNGMGHGDWSRAEWQSWGIQDWHTCDITLENLLVYGSEPAVIIHCAGSGSVSFSLQHPVQDYKRTVESTLNILEYVRLYTPKTRVVYPSSAAVYGVATTIPTSENSDLRPVSPYGVHKKLAEDLCKSYGQHFLVPVAVVRLFSIYGIGLRKQLLWDACEKISKNETQFYGTGDETRDWLSVVDAASLLFTASQYASETCPVVNGGFGKRIAVRDVLYEIFKCFQRSDTPVFYGRTRAGDPVHYEADITAALKWNWRPQIDWLKGIREYVEWYRGGTV